MGFCLMSVHLWFHEQEAWSNIAGVWSGGCRQFSAVLDLDTTELKLGCYFRHFSASWQ